MTVHRFRPLPRGILRGHFRVSHDLINDTQKALCTFYEAGSYEGGHEGICFWAGRELSNVTTLEAVVVPNALHERFRVFVSEKAFGEAARFARAMGLGILAQVHSHPGIDTRHSDGDDNLILMPFENMLSLIAPNYGRTIKSIWDFSVHQFQDHRWVLCDQGSVLDSFEII